MVVKRQNDSRCFRSFFSSKQRFRIPLWFHISSRKPHISRNEDNNYVIMILYDILTHVERNRWDYLQLFPPPAPPLPIYWVFLLFSFCFYHPISEVLLYLPFHSASHASSSGPPLFPSITFSYMQYLLAKWWWQWWKAAAYIFFGFRCRSFPWVLASTVNLDLPEARSGTENRTKDKRRTTNETLGQQASSAFLPRPWDGTYLPWGEKQTGKMWALKSD